MATTGLEETEARLAQEDPGLLASMRNEITGLDAQNMQIAAMPLKFLLFGAALDFMGGGEIFSAGGTNLMSGLTNVMQNTIGGTELSVTSFDVNGATFAPTPVAGPTPVSPAQTMTDMTPGMGPSAPTPKMGM